MWSRVRHDRLLGHVLSERRRGRLVEEILEDVFVRERWSDVERRRVLAGAWDDPGRARSGKRLAVG